MTFISLCLKTDIYTFITAEGKALSLEPAQVFNNELALNALPLPHQTLLTKKLAFATFKTA